MMHAFNTFLGDERTKKDFDKRYLFVEAFACLYLLESALCGLLAVLQRIVHQEARREVC